MTSRLNESMELFGNSSLPEARVESLWRYYYYDLWEAGADQRVTSFPLMKGGPWTVLAVIACYLYFVKVFGPQMMKNRKAYDLRPIILVYNVVMMVLNAYFFVSASYTTNFGLNTWGCIELDPTLWDAHTQWKLTMIWYFLITKFVDLMETVFFVLRKRPQQISFLHVFHHSVVPIDVWVGFKYSPSESACFFPLINSFIHTLMYLYYGLSTLGPAVRPYLWWKKYLTQLQILQLMLVAVHCLHLMALPNCGLPKAVFAIYFPQALFLVYLFTSFFIKNYIIPKNSPQKVE